MTSSTEGEKGGPAEVGGKAEEIAAGRRDHLLGHMSLLHRVDSSVLGLCFVPFPDLPGPWCPHSDPT